MKNLTIYHIKRLKGVSTPVFYTVHRSKCKFDMTFVTTLLNCVSSLENDVEVQVFTRLDSYAFEFLITETRIYYFVY